MMLTNAERRKLLKRQLDSNPIPQLPRLPFLPALILWVAVAALVPFGIAAMVMLTILYKALYKRTNKY